MCVVAMLGCLTTLLQTAASSRHLADLPATALAPKFIRADGRPVGFLDCNNVLPGSNWLRVSWQGMLLTTANLNCSRVSDSRDSARRSRSASLRSSVDNSPRSSVDNAA